MSTVELSRYDSVILSLGGLTERELYRLSWEISERLVAMEQERILGLYRASADMDDASDNWGGW